MLLASHRLSTDAPSGTRVLVEHLLYSDGFDGTWNIEVG